MTPEEYEKWLNERLDYYAKKAEDAENSCDEYGMNIYAAEFEAIGEALHKFTEVKAWIKENMLTKEWVSERMVYGEDY